MDKLTNQAGTEETRLSWTNGHMERLALRIFDISYESRGHIKAQVLADYVTKMSVGSSKGEEDNGWFLSMDEASNQTGSGAKVQYEVLLVGVRLAKELEAKTLTAKSDSKLVTGQVNEEYQARDP
ncbi:hypothetical protein CR513_32022, partial [Mucuna pruriens]